MSAGTEERNAAQGPGEITRGMRDGVEIHKAALQAGLNTRLLPRQVLQVYGRGGVKTSFTHGIPQASTLSGVTFTQDLRMRRGLLGKAGISQPRGATFSIGRGRRAIRRHARKVGYPLVVKPALGDSTIDVMRRIRNQYDLDTALNTLLTPPEEREGNTQAAYGITELRKPGWENGRVTVPPGYRVLVEEELQGEYLRLLLIGGKVVNAVRCDDDPWGEGNTGFPLESLPAEVKMIARQVNEALPGLSLFSVDFVVSADGEEGHSSRVSVVEVSERPWLEVQHSIDPALSSALARRILEAGIPDLPGREGQEDAAEVSAKFAGVVSPGHFISAVTAYAELHGLSCELRVDDRALGHVAGAIGGETASVVELVELILDTGIDGQSAMKADLNV